MVMGSKKPRTRITCWNCLQKVPIKYSGEACPNCGAPLTPKAYDARARELATQRRAFESELSKLQRQLNMAIRKNNRWGMLKNLPLLPSRRAIDELTPNTQQLREKIAELSHKRGFPFDRYYASEWFRQSRCFLRVNTSDPKVNASNPFGKPYYDQDGIFHMRVHRDNTWKRGVYGEYVVFSLLEEAIDAGELGPARLLWHLYIPTKQRLRSRGKAGIECTDEIDIALLTTHGLYSIEVKSLYCLIEVRPDSYQDGYSVITTRVGENGQPLTDKRAVDKGVAQNAGHVRALEEELAGFVPEGHVFNVTAYANSCGFEMSVSQGIGGAYVATTSEGPQNIVDVIRLIEGREETCWTKEQVDELADRMSIAYTDPDGSKREEHVKSIVTTHAPLPAPRRRHNKKNDRKPEKTKTRLRPKYQNRKSRFVEEELDDYLNGDYDDYDDYAS
jgi:hypothetical protein